MEEPRLVISYSHDDKEWADDFKADLDPMLQEIGAFAWIDTKDIRAGVDWQEAIDEAIDSCFALVVLMSDHAKASEYVTYEWSYALGQEKFLKNPKRVIFVLKEGFDKKNLHSRIKTLQHLDEADPQFRDRLRRAISQLFQSYLNSLADFSIPLKEIRDEGHAISQILAMGSVQSRIFLGPTRGAAIDEIKEFSTQNTLRERPSVRAAAIYALGLLGTPRGLNLIRQLLLNYADTDPAPILAAVQALKLTKDRSCLHDLYAILHHPNYPLEARQGALQAIVGLGSDDNTIPSLSIALTTCEGNTVGLARLVIEELGKIGHKSQERAPGIYEIMVSYLKADRVDRFAGGLTPRIASVLTLIGKDRAKEIASLLTDDAYDSNAVISVLKEMKSSNVLETLKEIVGSWISDAQRRQTAWLVIDTMYQIDPMEAIRYLNELFDDHDSESDVQKEVLDHLVSYASVFRNDPMTPQIEAIVTALCEKLHSTQTNDFVCGEVRTALQTLRHRNLAISEFLGDPVCANLE